VQVREFVGSGGFLSSSLSVAEDIDARAASKSGSIVVGSVAEQSREILGDGTEHADSSVEGIRRFDSRNNKWSNGEYGRQHKLRAKTREMQECPR